jgi:hypothetical protein
MVRVATEVRANIGIAFAENSGSAEPGGVCSLGGAALKLGPEIPQQTSVCGSMEKVQKKSPAGGTGPFRGMSNRGKLLGLIIRTDRDRSLLPA